MGEPECCPTGRGEGNFEAKKSRFLALAMPCATAAQAREELKKIRSEHPQARHVVHAFRIGEEGSVQEGCSDDGEPHGTAGRPVLDVLRGAGALNILLVVVRYFGGTKLGTGPLARAYGVAAQAAMQATPLQQRVRSLEVTLRFGWERYDALRRFMQAHQVQIIEEIPGSDVCLRCRVPETEIREFAEAVRDLCRGNLIFELS